MAREAIKRKRQRAQRRGQVAEYFAALYLFAKGYRIIALRYKTALGEIDIIAQRGALVAFVEVKRRTDHGLAIDAVSFESQNRIRAASEIWMARQPNACAFSFRYDIIVMRPFRLPLHVINGF